MGFFDFLQGPFGGENSAIGPGGSGTWGDLKRNPLSMANPFGNNLSPLSTGGGGALGGSFTPGGVDFSQQQNFLSALQGPQGLQSQNFLSGQLQQQAMGQGPNPAQAMLAQNTGQNISQQAALMNSARGANANPGLMGRQAANVGGNLQQQAVGQAATMRAQQQLAAQQQLQQLAGQQVGQQQAGLQGLGQMQTSLAENQNVVNAQMAEARMKQQTGLLGGLMNGVGGALGAASMADGGVVGEQEGPQSILGQYVNGGDEKLVPYDKPTSSGSDKGSQDSGQGLGALVGLGMMAMMAASKGGAVPGKANVPGDSQQNDTVSAKLSPGEVVIPRSKVGSPQATAHFLNALLGFNLRA